MSCTYSIKINGKTVEILVDIPEGAIKDINDLEKYLRLDNNKLGEIKEILQSINKIEELDIDRLNENSVGLYSPTDLITNIAQYDLKERTLWGKLKLGDKSKRVVISGFSNDKIHTQFYKDHIFLNLNYMYDLDNKIIALTELALYNYDSENYTENSIKLRTNPEENEVLIKKLINSKYESEINFLVKNIQLAYAKTNVKLGEDIAENNFPNSRETIQTVWDTYEALDQEDNYAPKMRVRVENLKQGDLVLTPIENIKGETSPYQNGVYEMFYDSYVDINGKTIIQTIGKSSDGSIRTYKRIAKAFSKDSSGNKNIVESNTIESRIFNNEIYSDYKYYPETKYSEIETKFYKNKALSGQMNYNSLLALLKNSQMKVVINKEQIGIKSIKGSVVILTNEKKLGVWEIQKIAYPLINIPAFGKLSEEDLKKSDSIWSKYSNPTPGEHIAFKKKVNDIDLTEGVVIGSAIRSGNKIVLYVTAKGEKSGQISYIKESNIKFVSNPPLEFHIGIEEKNDIIKQIGDIGLDFTNNITKQGFFKDAKYSMQEVNEYSVLNSKDFLVDKRTGQIFKVVASKQKIVKTSFLKGDKYVYFDIDKEDLNNFVLFTKTHVNISFAKGNIFKNRYALFNSQRENSISVKVWKNPNGFVYSLPKALSNSEVMQHQLYEKGAIDITSQMKKELTERFKWEKIPTDLYLGYFASNKNPMTNNDYSNFIKIDNEILSKIMSDNSETNSLRNYILPGSYITFKGNSKQYIVEKVYKDSILVSYYHYTQNSNNSNKNKDLNYVKSEKFFINNESLTRSEIVGLHIPKWATVAQSQLSLIQKVDFKKQSKFNPLTKADSVEVIVKMINIIKDKFGVNIKIIDNSELEQFNDPKVNDAAAFVTKDQIYINIDKASIEEPLHELLHLVLATMKHSNQRMYYSLVGAIQTHPLFKSVLEQYNEEINTEILEETFIKLLSKTFRKNIEKSGVFKESDFNTAMLKSTQELMDLSDSLDWQDSFDLLGKPLKEVIFDFGSSLIVDGKSMINQESVNYMFDISQTIRELLDSGKLKQKCNY